jgi:hypothetical protein
MRSTFESTLPWWLAGPVLGLVITVCSDFPTSASGLSAA